MAHRGRSARAPRKTGRGEPFVGRAGQLLNSMLRAIGLAREQVYIANVLKCRPPGNRDPAPNEIAECLPYLERQIALLKPRIMLAVGRIAAQNLLRTDTPLGRLRQQVHSLRHLARAAGRDLSSRLSAAYAGGQAQGVGRFEIRTRGMCTCPALSRTRFRGSTFGRCTNWMFPWSWRSSAPPISFPGAKEYFRDCLRVGYVCRVVDVGGDIGGLRHHVRRRRRGAHAQCVRAR